MRPGRRSSPRWPFLRLAMPSALAGRMSAMSTDASRTPRTARPTAAPAGTLITVAPTGAETAKTDCPQLPTTLDELVETAVACEAAGAAMIHVHIRDDEHRPSLDSQRLKDTVAALRES